MNGDFLQRVEDHYEDPYHRGRCERPTHYGEAKNNEPCRSPDQSDRRGDVVAIEFRITVDSNEHEVIEDAWFDGQGCKLSQAIASMLSEHVEEMRTETLANMSLDEMLRSLAIEVDPTARACCNVALQAAKAALVSPCEDDLEGPTFGGPDLGDEC